MTAGARDGGPGSFRPPRFRPPRRPVAPGPAARRRRPPICSQRIQQHLRSIFKSPKHFALLCKKQKVKKERGIERANTCSKFSRQWRQKSRPVRRLLRPAACPGALRQGVLKPSAFLAYREKLANCRKGMLVLFEAWHSCIACRISQVRFLWILWGPQNSLRF